MPVHNIAPMGCSDFAFDFTDFFAGRAPGTFTVESDSELTCELTDTAGAVATVTIRALTTAQSGRHYRMSCTGTSADGILRETRTVSIWILPL